MFKNFVIVFIRVIVKAEVAYKRKPINNVNVSQLDDPANFSTNFKFVMPPQDEICFQHLSNLSHLH